MIEEINEGNKIIAEFMGLFSHKNIADWSDKDQFCITDAIHNFMKNMVVAPKGKGFKWLLTRHRGLNIQVFTDGNYQKVADSDVEIRYGKYTLDALKYATSWDWIMPVWEKICNSEDPYMINGNIKLSFCSIDVLDAAPRPYFCRLSNISTIDAIWLTCIDYIKWYNLKNGIK